MTQFELTPLAEGFAFLDGLRWHDNRLWASDFFRHEVVRIGLDGSREVVAEVPGEPSGLGFLPDGTPLVVSQHQQRLYKIGPRGELSLHAELGEVVRGNANDMVVASDGRAYVGNFGFDPRAGEQPAPTNLAVVAPDGSVAAGAGDLLFPNGCVLTSDERTLLVAETFGYRITAFDVAEDGTLSNGRLWAQLGEGVTPDGMALDSSGAVWVGTVWGEKFLRVSEGGEILDEIPTPGRWAVGCVFGGADRRTLFCTTAETTLEDHGKGIAKASIGTVDTGHAGAGTP